MQKQSSQSVKIYQSVMFVLCWFALAGQFYLNVINKEVTVSEMLIRYFSFFTIQVNIIIAICFTILLFSPDSKWGAFFSKQTTLAAITVYIVIVGLIYNTILRFLWAPTGLQKIVDELLHSIIPVSTFLYWLFFAGKNGLQWKSIWPWLIYPFAYIIYILIRGSMSGYYPYPFVNTTELGLNKVLVNSVGIAAVFIIASFAFVAVGKSLNKKL